MTCHASGSDVDRRRRGQERSVRLLLQLTVSAPDITFGKGIPRGTIHTHSVRGGGRAAIDYTGRAGEEQHLVGRSVASAVRPGFALIIDVEDASLLHDRLNSNAGSEGGIESVASAHPLVLPRILIDNSTVGRAVDRRKLAELIEPSGELARSNQSLLPGTGCRRPDGNLRRAGSLCAFQKISWGQPEIDYGRREFEILGCG